MSPYHRWNTQATVGLILLVVGVAAAIVLALSIPAGAPLHPGGSSLPTGQVSGAALGERIFLTGADENGNVIPRSGVTRMMGSAVVCANCHGSDARGRTVRMVMGQIEAPNIRWGALTAPPADPAEKAFDPELLRRGGPGHRSRGRDSEVVHARWELSRSQSDALIEYLKTR